MRPRFLAAWLALLAMALQALFPLLAQAQPRRVALVPICSAGEPGRTVEVPLHDPAPAAEHCPACFLGGDTPLFLVLPEVRFSPAIACLPGNLSLSPSFRDSFSPAHPRAPPPVV
jgi:hypothetical protein